MRHLRVCRAAVLACSQAGECTLPSLQSAQALLPQNRRLLSNCGTYQCNAQHSQLPSALSPACNFHTGVPATAAGGSSGSSSPGSPRTARRESAAAPWLPYGADSYKELVRQAFDGVAEQSVAEEADGARGASGDPLADKMLQGMLQRAQLLRGQRVLDVACGKGPTSCNSAMIERDSLARFAACSLHGSVQLWYAVCRHSSPLGPRDMSLHTVLRAPVTYCRSRFQRHHNINEQQGERPSSALAVMPEQPMHP